MLSLTMRHLEVRGGRLDKHWAHHFVNCFLQPHHQPHSLELCFYNQPSNFVNFFLHFIEPLIHSIFVRIHFDHTSVGCFDPCLCTSILMLGSLDLGFIQSCPTKTLKHRHINPRPRPRKVSPEMHRGSQRPKGLVTWMKDKHTKCHQEWPTCNSYLTNYWD
jgi:hypothetical protein